jgi:diacylglycerol kinase (ATP)
MLGDAGTNCRTLQNDASVGPAAGVKDDAEFIASHCIAVSLPKLTRYVCLRSKTDTTSVDLPPWRGVPDRCCGVKPDEECARANLHARVKVARRASAALHRRTLTVKRIFSATINSLHGLAYGFRSEPALREEIVLLAAGLFLGLAIAPSVAWYVMMVGSLLVLLAVEFLNTGLEKLSDHVTREQHIEIRRIKDFGSAAVFCGICLAGITWLAALVVRCGLL